MTSIISHEASFGRPLEATIPYDFRLPWTIPEFVRERVANLPLPMLKHVSTPDSNEASNSKKSPDLRIEPVLAPNGVAQNGPPAPWHENVRVLRASSTDGSPVSPANSHNYRKLFEKLYELLEDEEVCSESVITSVDLLKRCLFSGAIAPALSWHGTDAVVFIWNNKDACSLFTISGRSFSYLKEENGIILERVDDIPLSNWQLIFPIHNANYPG